MNQTVTYRIVDVSVPDIIFKYTNCTNFLLHSSELYSISSCTDITDNKIYLVVFSYLSSSPFFAQSLETNIGKTARMYITSNILFVVDGQSPTIHTYRITLGQGGNTTNVIEPINTIDTVALQATDLEIVSADSFDFGIIIRTFILDPKGVLRTIDISPTTGLFSNLTTTDF